MNCHNHNRQKHQNHSPLKHILHMVLCCGLPIVLVGFLPLIASVSPSAGAVISKIVPFLCPLMMIGMIPMMMMGEKKKSCCKVERYENNNGEVVK